MPFYQHRWSLYHSLTYILIAVIPAASRSFSHNLRAALSSAFPSKLEGPHIFFNALPMPSCQLLRTSSASHSSLSYDSTISFSHSDGSSFAIIF